MGLRDNIISIGDMVFINGPTTFLQKEFAKKYCFNLALLGMEAENQFK